MIDQRCFDQKHTFLFLRVRSYRTIKIPFAVHYNQIRKYALYNIDYLSKLKLLYKWTGHRARRPLSDMAEKWGHVIGWEKGRCFETNCLLVRRASKVLIGINWFCACLAISCWYIICQYLSPSERQTPRDREISKNVFGLV